MPRVVQWLNENAYRSYPFVEDSDMSAGTQIVPTDLLLDLQLLEFIEAEASVTLKSITVAGITIDLVLEYGAITRTITSMATAATHTPVNYGTADPYRITAIFGPGLATVGEWPDATYTLTTPAPIEPALLNFENNHRVASVQGLNWKVLDNCDVLTGWTAVEWGSLALSTDLQYAGAGAVVFSTASIPGNLTAGTELMRRVSIPVTDLSKHSHLNLELYSNNDEAEDLNLNIQLFSSTACTGTPVAELGFTALHQLVGGWSTSTHYELPFPGLVGPPTVRSFRILLNEAYTGTPGNPNFSFGFIIDDIKGVTPANQELLSGVVFVREGHNCRVSVDANRDLVIVSASRGSGRGLSCDPVDSTVALCGEVLLRINGLTADSSGNFLFLPGPGVQVKADPDNNRVIFSSSLGEEEVKCG